MGTSLNDATAASDLKIVYDEFVEQIKSESDRAAIILSASKLDYSLYQLLGRCLVPTGNKKDELLDSDENGPVSTLSARILLCHRVGIINGEFARALHLVRKLRNDCSHEVVNMDINRPPYRERIRDIVAIVSRTQLFTDIKNMYYYDKTGLAADLFATLTLLAVRLDTLFYKVQPIPSNQAFPIVPPNYSKQEVKPDKKKKRLAPIKPKDHKA